MAQGYEQGFFFQEAGQRLFGVLHRPAPDGVSRATGWVFCGPFAEERGLTHRLMVEWARVLCGEGYPVLRFDYRGYGESEGRFEDVAVDDHVTDALAAVRELCARTGIERVGLCGLRLGGAVAALAASKLGGDHPLVLWNPIVRGPAYIEDLLREFIAREMTNTGRAPRTRAELRTDLAEGRIVMLEGHALDARIAEALGAIDLTALPRPGGGPVLIVQTGRSRRPAKDLAALRETYAAGGETHFDHAQTPVLWSSQEMKEYEDRVRPTALFDCTREWVLENVGETARPPQIPRNRLTRRRRARSKSPSPLRWKDSGFSGCSTGRRAKTATARRLCFFLRGSMPGPHDTASTF